MKLCLDSNLSLSLTSKACDKKVHLVVLGIEQINDDGTSEHLATFRNFENVQARDVKRDLMEEQAVIKKRVDEIKSSTNGFYQFKSFQAEYRWFTFFDRSNRLFTFLTLAEVEDKNVMKLIEKVKTAVIYFKSNQDKLQQKVDSMGNMFNDSMSFDSNSNIDFRENVNLSKISNSKDVSQMTQDVIQIKASTEPVNTELMGQQTEEAKQLPVSLSKKLEGWNLRQNMKWLFLSIVLISIIYVLVHKFTKLRHKKH